MADATHLPTARKGITTEYRVYFAIIFVAALPFALAAWLKDALLWRREALTESILYRAVRQAELITPRIFQQ